MNDGTPGGNELPSRASHNRPRLARIGERVLKPTAMSAFTITSTPVVRASAASRASARAPVAAALRPPSAKISTGVARSAALRIRRRRASSLTVRAEAEAETAAAPAESLPPVPGTFVKICDADELPRGTRKKVSALGKSILMFWYKDSMVAIECRSPAEGAFSEGFENARLTQDGCIVCPATRSTFDLKTGERMQTIGLWLGGFALLLLIGLLWGQRRAAKATLAHSRDMDARRRRRREATAARAEEPPAS